MLRSFKMVRLSAYVGYEGRGGTGFRPLFPSVFECQSVEFPAMSGHEQDMVSFAAFVYVPVAAQNSQARVALD